MKNWEIKNFLMINGMKVEDSAKSQLNSDDSGLVKYGDYVTIGDLMLNLGKETYVSVNEKENSPYILKYINGKFCIAKQNKDEEKIDILVDGAEITQPPKSTAQTFTIKGGEEREITNYNNLHMDRIRIQPISGCNNDCRFCDLCGSKYEEKDVDDLEKAYDIVEKQNPGIIENMLISGGTPKETNQSYEYINGVYERFGKIGKEKGYSVDVMMAPRGMYTADEAEKLGVSTEENYRLFFEFLRDNVGITDLSVNLELWNEKYREQLIPRKNSYNREEYLKYIDIAVQELGQDVIRSSVIVGLEPVEDSKVAIEELAKRGCRVVLSPYQPFKPINMEDEEQRFGKVDSDIRERVCQINLSPEDMNNLVKYTVGVTEKYNVGFGSKYAKSNHNNLSITGAIGDLKKGEENLEDLENIKKNKLEVLKNAEELLDNVNSVLKKNDKIVESSNGEGNIYE